jgi:hypothetical protein
VEKDEAIRKNIKRFLESFEANLLEIHKKKIKEIVIIADGGYRRVIRLDSELKQKGSVIKVDGVFPDSSKKLLSALGGKSLKSVYMSELSKSLDYESEIVKEFIKERNDKIDLINQIKKLVSEKGFNNVTKKGVNENTLSRVLKSDTSLKFKTLTKIKIIAEKL